MAEENKTEEERADADAGQKLDKCLEALSDMSKRMDAMEEEDERKADAARKDAEEEEEARAAADKKKDDEGDMPGDPERVAADKKKDAEEEEERKADKARRDEAEEERKADSAATRKAIADLESKLPKQLTDADYTEMADAQARADTVYQALGKSAPRPLNGEDLGAYRRRMATDLKDHSPALKAIDLVGVADSAAFGVLETQIYADAMQAALKPTDLPEGHLREIKTRDTTGRQISTFAGEPRSWMRSHQGQRRRLSGINRDQRG